jgi:hypothetical protein
MFLSANVNITAFAQHPKRQSRECRKAHNKFPHMISLKKKAPQGGGLVTHSEGLQSLA